MCFRIMEKRRQFVILQIKMDALTRTAEKALEQQRSNFHSELEHPRRNFCFAGEKLLGRRETDRDVERQRDREMPLLG